MSEVVINAIVGTTFALHEHKHEMGKKVVKMQVKFNSVIQMAKWKAAVFEAKAAKAKRQQDESKGHFQENTDQRG